MKWDIWFSKLWKGAIAAAAAAVISYLVAEIPNVPLTAQDPKWLLLLSALVLHGLGQVNNWLKHR